LKDKGYKIKSAGNVHLEPMAVYSKKYKSLKDLPKGATVYVSNNPAEEGRFFSTISSNLASSILTPFLILISPASWKNFKKRPSSAGLFET
jgi:hypothetical protein